MSNSLPVYSPLRIKWNGKWSDEVGTYGVIVQGYTKQNIPEREITEIDIPSQDYPLLYDKGVFKSFTQTYNLVWRKRDTKSVENWLYHLIGYGQLTDEYHYDKENDTGYYREAYVLGGTSVDSYAETLYHAAISFKCKPFWYSDCSIDATAKAKTTSPIDLTIKSTQRICTPPVVVFKWSSAVTVKLKVTAYCVQYVEKQVPVGPEMVANVDEDATCEELCINCDDMTGYYISSGSKTWIAPKAEYEWPKLGYQGEYNYNGITLSGFTKTNLTSAVVTYKECHLI